MSSSPLLDLTGKVRKTQTYYFANGALADIWRGEWFRGSMRQIVAVKVIRDVRDNIDYFEVLKMKLLREGKVWSRLDHPNITPFYGVCFDLGPPSAPCLVCPYYKNGNMTKYLQQNPNADRMRLVCQVAAGLCYLHRQNIIHGDMKASNILVDDRHEARIADFGLARILGESGFTTKTVSGTYRWMAPELLAPEGVRVPQVTMASDVWAFGITALEILTGRVPFFQFGYGLAVIHAITKGCRPQREEYPEINGNTWSVLEPCWHTDRERRPSMEFCSAYLG